MLNITIPKIELFDERTSEFITFKEEHLQMEHSLVSISKWEAKWNKPFLSSSEKTVEEILDYIRCMTISKDVSPEVLERLTEQNIMVINDYINAPMTATTFNDANQKGSREIVTSEVIYYWMITLNIPFECQYWHLNRLLTLVKVCNVKNSPPKKMSKQEILEQNRRLNAERRKQMNTRG